MNRYAVEAGALLLMVTLDASASAAQGWQPVEPMSFPRAYHAAAKVGDRWYVAGGVTWFGTGSGERFPAEVEAYDPKSGHWAAVGGLAQGRDYLLAVTDSSRARVLFSGGFLPTGPNSYLALPTCDVAGTDGVSSAPDLVGARHLHAVAFAAGWFIVSGGWGGGTSSALVDVAEVWDGTSSPWLLAGRMPAGARARHTMTTLQNGYEVLVIGGSRPDRALSDVDVFNASCRTWSTSPSLKVARVGHEAVLLKDGRVLVVGGDSFPNPNVVQRSAELFDPTTHQWKLAASMTDARFDFDMVLLPDGRVLVAGGSNNATYGEFGALSSAEVYDPASDTWTPLPPMHDRRRWPTLAVLSDGVYVAGGSFASSIGAGSGMVLASVERLGWSDLGIAGTIDPDAGVPDAPSPDAGSTCAPQDAGMDSDAALDAGASSDGGSDASPPPDATDASARDLGSPDREAGGGGSGCSCHLRGAARDAFGELVLASVVLAAALRRRPRARGRYEAPDPSP